MLICWQVFLLPSGRGGGAAGGAAGEVSPGPQAPGSRQGYHRVYVGDSSPGDGASSPSLPHPIDWMPDRGAFMPCLRPGWGPAAVVGSRVVQVVSARRPLVRRRGSGRPACWGPGLRARRPGFPWCGVWPGVARRAGVARCRTCPLFSHVRPKGDPCDQWKIPSGTGAPRNAAVNQ